MRFTRSARFAAVAVASIAIVGSIGMPAHADPDFAPDADDLVGVGSDTTQNVVGDLTKAYNGQTPAPTRRLASFDATGSATITIRPGVSITRPNGSSAGISAVATNPDVDFARSSRGRQASDAADLGFIRFAQDKLRWVANDDVTGLPELTDAQLSGIYDCSITNWSQIPGGPNLAITPVVPQPDSGTRDAWATAVGIDSDNLPPCVTDTIGGQLVQEHDPAPIAATAGAVAPISQGRWEVLDPADQAGAVLGQITDPADYDRDVYHVVKLDGGGAVPAHLADIFGDGFGAASDGVSVPWLCVQSDPSTPEGAEAGEIIAAHGFSQLPVGTCGTI